MKYQNIKTGRFLSRPNRFIAYVDVDGIVEKVHVKNTGRCKELLVENAVVYLEKAREESDVKDIKKNTGEDSEKSTGDNSEKSQKSPAKKRSTGYDLVAVEKDGRIVNMDSQAPNAAVKEWLEKGGLNSMLVKPETTFGDSRFDFYIETEDGKKGFVEVKGVTLEEDGVACFPDAPSDRAVKHLHELIKAREAGFSAFLLFVVQMDKVHYVIPNHKTQPEFAEALEKARYAGVQVLAYDCEVTADEMKLRNLLPVYTSPMEQIAEPLLSWYDGGRRILPWREDPTPYHVWLSEIMLQQTRVEAVKPYYDRFLSELPDVKSLSQAEEEKLLKLWEGLGYYNRVRNMQKAATVIMDVYQGSIPSEYEELCKLPGIGSYTAGAISSIAFGRKVPAVDGNVLRVLTRILMCDQNVLDAKVKKDFEQRLQRVMPEERAGDFNQAMMELGATVCLPNGKPRCDVCPLGKICRARQADRMMEYPYKTAKMARTIEKKTVLILQDDQKAALQKRPDKGLLAGMYEFPWVEGEKSQKSILEYLKKAGFPAPVRIRKLENAKHIFSHKEWHMWGYSIWMDQLSSYEEAAEKAGFIFVDKREMEQQYPIPSAYAAYTRYLNVLQGADKYKKDRS